MLPPDLVAKLAQCATHDFVGPRDLWFGRLARFTTAVFVGLVFELPELWYELKLIAREWIPYFRYRILTPPERNIQAAKVLAFVGWILIVVGVGGERYSEVKVKDLDASIQECGEAKLRAATLEAGDAATSAEQAKFDANAARGEADAAKDSAREAKALLGELRRQILIQGPRARALEAGKEVVIKAVKPFLGQKITLVKCGRMPVIEADNFEGKLRALLGEKEVGWDSNGDATWDACTGRLAPVPFNTIVVSSDAEKPVKDAAVALEQALSAIDIMTAQIRVTPGEEPASLQWNFPFCALDSPCSMALHDPSRLFFIVSNVNGMIDVKSNRKQMERMQKDSRQAHPK
jgi:hypothetical protein